MNTLSSDNIVKQAHMHVFSTTMDLLSLVVLLGVKNEMNWALGPFVHI